MKTWITSDWHLGDNRIELLARPFSSVDEMNSTLIENHNKLVNPEDKVIVVGDVTYKEATEYIDLVSKFNGRKILICGNHDVNTSKETFLKYFDEVIEEGKGLDLDVEGISCYINHYPSQGKTDKFNLVGHVHAAWKHQLNMVNVGVDANHFFPIDLATIPSRIEAITKYYDQDIWAAYLPQNKEYLTTRGKKGSYFGEVPKSKWEQAWHNMIDDGFNWYYGDYGEKCYATAVFTGIPMDESIEVPPPSGTYLYPHETNPNTWITQDGIEIMCVDVIAQIETQRGQGICKFISESYGEAKKSFKI